MRITHLELTDFRNIAQVSIDPGEGVNIIYGANAQGKTNLLEAIWLCSGNKSFRGAREREMTRFGEKVFHIRLQFADPANFLRFGRRQAQIAAQPDAAAQCVRADR